jgi:hypothetical protein
VLYRELFGGGEKFGSVIDLGCGVNGFSYGRLFEVLGGVSYVGVEAAGQIVKNSNEYFKEEGFDARLVKLDLFELDKVVDLIRSCKGPRVVFMFQVVDALENLEKDFSKKFIEEIMKVCDVLILSLPLESLSGRKNFEVDRKWLVDFLEGELRVEKDFKMFGERFIYIRK